MEINELDNNDEEEGEDEVEMFNYEEEVSNQEEETFNQEKGKHEEEKAKETLQEYGLANLTFKKSQEFILNPNEWYIDSAVSKHMTPHKEGLKNLER